MKKIYIILGTITITLLILLLDYTKKENSNYIEYNGFKLALSIDGETVSEIPSSGKYFLVDYTCNHGTILAWDYNNSILTSSNQNINDTCSLSFETSPTLYDLTSIGDYILYNGDSANGCVEPQCSGWNANQTATDLYENFGYTGSDDHRYNVYGWRVLYKNNNSVYITSAGSVEAVKAPTTTTSSSENIKNLNNTALKYCNSDYLSGGTCDATTAHAFNGDDFYNFTSQYYGTNNARYLYNYDDGGTFGSPYCLGINIQYCGYNDDIISNGGSYWFGSAKSSTSTIHYQVPNSISYRSNYSTYVSNGATYKISVTFGVRPVLKLDATILATGGTGTMTDPYTISTRTTS